MEQLADVGNGNYAYIDTLKRRAEVLVSERNADDPDHRQGREDPGRVQPGGGRASTA